MGFSGVGLICGLWLWVCFVVFCGFVLLWLWVCWWWLCCVGDAMLALDCVFFFFLVQLLGFVVVAGGPTVGWVSVAPSKWVLGQWVAAWICCLGFFFFFFGVDGRLWVAGGGCGGGGVRCV